MFFTIALKVTKHLCYFCNKIRCQEIPKIAQSGHNGHRQHSRANRSKVHSAKFSHNQFRDVINSSFPVLDKFSYQFNVLLPVFIPSFRDKGCCCPILKPVDELKLVYFKTIRLMLVSHKNSEMYLLKFIAFCLVCFQFWSLIVGRNFVFITLLQCLTVVL